MVVFCGLDSSCRTDPNLTVALKCVEMVPRKDLQNFGCGSTVTEKGASLGFKVRQASPGIEVDSGNYPVHILCRAGSDEKPEWKINTLDLLLLLF